ncbi:amidohydrolase [Mesobaculum littorinae]|uniref:Amidohydrolase n=1 Tax=Mesobaculum littorinae TaxID=2486419 RepID=A0A438AHI9_9RHOB|nr:amidohydrolase family protein [Mesobaculum littorinae]RVV98134.1 amidohydrolase [Mesobaculum littorinae]
MADTVLERDRTADAKLGIVDCDIHPGFRSKGELAEYLPEGWKRHARDFGLRWTNPFLGALPYPRLGHGMRQDSYPPGGGAAGSDLDFMREQLLDPLNVEFGMLQPLGPGPYQLNPGLAAALCGAYNDWQVDRWTSKEPRLKGAITIPQEDAAASIKEIEARKDDKGFAQIAVAPRGMEGAGKQRYWPIYELAESLDLPIGMHVAAHGYRPNTGSGWVSFYLEEHHAVSHQVQNTLASMIFEGVFERFPKLKVVLIEGGFAWVAPLLWRMDREWERLKDEVPHLKKKPSDYFRSNVWLTTQPVEEPPKVKRMTDLLRWVGTDRLMFSTDYPHWDFDHPERAFKVGMTDEVKRAIMRDTARAVYNL